MRAALTTTVCLLLVAAPAAAQLSEADRRVAQEHFERGTLAFERGDYDEASAEFRAAYELTQHADLLYNIYSAQERNGELSEAADALEGYLRDGSPDDGRREALELRLERLRLRIEQERLLTAEAEAEAQRERVAAATQLEAEQAGREAAEQQAASEREGRLAQVRSRAQTAESVSLAGIVVLVAGGAGLGSFGVFAGLSEAEDASLASSCGRDAGRVCRPGRTETLEQMNLAADISLIAGATLALAGAVMVLIGEGLRPSEDDGGDDADAQRASVNVRPLLGPSGAGVGVGGRW